MNRILLSLKNVYSSYDNNKIVLKNINFDIKEGDFIAILGENGAGKSSIIKTIYGLCKKIKGDIIFNFDSRKKYNSLSNYASVILNKINNFYDFLVSDFLDYGVLNIDKNIFSKKSQYFFDYKKELFRALNVDKFIEQKKHILDLSQGELQRVLLAQGMLKNPKILFLDESLANLDINYKFEILHIFKLFYSSGTAFFVILHDIKLAYKYFNKIIFLKDGMINGIFEKTNKINTIEIFKEKEKLFLDLVCKNFNISKNIAREYIF